MTQPSLIAVFGTNATQTATDLIIKKADLPGLTPLATNTAESLLVGVLLRAEIDLTTTARDADPDRNIAIEAGFDSISYRGTTPYYQSQRAITFQKINTGATIDPDDY
jgi:hypothetical protein